MLVSPDVVGNIHFIGIGGIGMSGLAAILHAAGYKVRGSDIGNNPNIQRLQASGISITIGHSAEHVEGAAIVVVSSAIKADNPEVIAARAQGIPVVKRAEMLAEIMRIKPSISVAGTHGKTTTTSLLAHLLDTMDWDPTVVSGGIINSFGTNARLGSGEWIVVEADESDGSFVKLPATLGIITNIDAEHLDHYGTYENLLAAFETFIENIPFYGLGVLCWDHVKVRELAGRITDRRVVTYGLQDGALVQAVNIRNVGETTVFDIKVTGAALKLKGLKEEVDDHFSGFCLPMLGLHNVQNAVAAITIAFELGMSPGDLYKVFESFKGIQRRFTKVGVANGVTVIDDYAHHPAEIIKALETARLATKGRVVAVVQPHRYSRLEGLFDDFCTCVSGADEVIVVPVYGAGESSIEGVDHKHLAEGMKRSGHASVRAIDLEEELSSAVGSIVSEGDYVVCLGAGNVTEWARALPQALQKYLGEVKYGT